MILKMSSVLVGHCPRRTGACGGTTGGGVAVVLAVDGGGNTTGERLMIEHLTVSELGFGC